MKLAALVVSFVMFASLSHVCTASAGCVDYGDYLHCTGTAFSYGACFGVAVSGEIACVIEGQAFHGLQMIDVSDPNAPVVLGTLPLTWPWGVALSGKFAYVADGSSGLRVISIADPENPQIVGQLSTPAEARGVAVSGNLVYVADNTAGLLIVDVSDPQHPRRISQIDTPVYAVNVAVSGGYAYVADWSDLQVVDVTDPAAPQIVGAVTVTACDVAVRGEYAYVASLYSGLHVIDVADPHNPQIVASGTTPGSAQAVALAGDAVFVPHMYSSDGRTGVYVFDCSDPTDPQVIGCLETTSAWDIVTSATHAYLADSRGLDVLDISNPHNVPVTGATVSLGGYGACVDASDGYAYMASELSFFTVDVSDPTRPAIICSLETSASDLSIAGALACLANGNGLQIVDISDPGNTRLRGFVDTPGSAARVAVSGGHAYVADGSSGLQVVRIVNPDHPLAVGSVDTPGLAKDVAVQGAFAYVADGEAGLTVIDISVPAMPRIAGHVDTASDAQGVAVLGSCAYVADGIDGLVVISIADPEAPVVLGNTVTPVMTAFRVEISGDRAYVVDGRGGVQVVDVADPAHPRMIGGVSPFGDVQAAVISLPYVYAVCQQHLPYTQYCLDVLPAQCDPAGIAGIPSQGADLSLTVYPNPARGSTAIGLTSREASPMRAAIYDLGGRLVKTLSAGWLPAGRSELFWCGRDEAGREVANGIYLARVEAAGEKRTTRVVMLR